MEVPSSEGELKAKITEIFSDVSEVIITNPGLLGQGMVGLALYVTVKFLDSEKPDKHLFAKTHTSNQFHTESIEQLKAFEKEARFFTEYIPAAEEFCKSKGQEKLMDIYPKCYYGDKTLILLENLVLEKGYVMLNKEAMQGFDEASHALTTLAKHHAISYAMIEGYGGPRQFFEKFTNLDFDPFLHPSAKETIGPLLDMAVSTGIRLLEGSEVEGRDDAISIFKSSGPKVMELLTEALSNTPDEKTLLLLNHGDFWNNNMLFLKDKTTNKVLHLKAIDLQITRYNTPVLDLAYYLFSSVENDLRQTKLEELLKIYLHSLQTVSKELGFPIALSYEDLFAEFRKKFQYGFWFGLCHNGPAVAVMKDFNTDDFGGSIEEWEAEYNKLVEKWFQKNQEKAKCIAVDIVGLVREYQTLLPN